MIVAEISLTNSPNSPSSKTKWHSKSWWTAVGVVFALIGVAIGYAAWQYPNSPENTKIGADTSSSSTAPTAISSTPSEAKPSISPTIASTSPPSGPTDVQVAGSSNQMFLSDIPQKNFIKEPSLPQRGAAKIDNHEYPSSYSYRFTNCSNCTYEVEVNLPGQYKRFAGVFGLTDETRHDNVIDGVVYFSIYSSTGDPLLQPQKVEYPAQVPFDIDVTGVSRVRLTVSSGTNVEYPCWCDARFSK